MTDRTDINRGSLYRRDVAERFLDALKANGFNFAVPLPDTVLYILDELLLGDPEVDAVIPAREDEGIGIAFGAYLGGKKPVVLMEGSGVGLSPLILARGILHRLPILIIAAHNTVYGERYSYHGATRLVLQPVLDALRIPYHVLRDPSEIPWVIRELSLTMSGQRVPGAILVPRHIMMEG